MSQNKLEMVKVVLLWLSHLFLLVIVQSLSCSVCRRVTPKLGMAKVTQVDFPPREIVSYTKETQTPVLTQTKEGDVHLFYLFMF